LPPLLLPECAAARRLMFSSAKRVNLTSVSFSS
jgi:hypothetical protein